MKLRGSRAYRNQDISSAVPRRDHVHGAPDFGVIDDQSTPGPSASRKRQGDTNDLSSGGVSIFSEF